MTVELILAKTKNNCIGFAGDMPWRLRDDLNYFKQVTDGKHVIMGRKTLESIPGSLPNRFITVVTRDRRYRNPKAHYVIHDLADGNIKAAVFTGSAFHLVIAGGATIYNEIFSSNEWMEKISVIHVTEIDADIVGDTFIHEFPDLSDWDSEAIGSYPADDRNSHPFTIVKYTRKP